MNILDQGPGWVEAEVEGTRAVTVKSKSSRSSRTRPAAAPALVFHTQAALLDAFKAGTLAGPDHRWVLPLSMVLAPALLVLADTVGRLVLPPGEVSAGVMTAVLGAPAFLWLVHRSREVGL